MAGEIQTRFASARNLYFQVRSSTGTVWNGSAFVSYATVDISTYSTTMTESGTASGYYLGTFPTGITTAGIYTIVIFDRLGAGVAETDPTVGFGDIEWTGTVVGSFAALLPAKVRKNTALANFMFKMVQTDGLTSATGLTVTAQRSLDGAAFANCANSVVEVSGGWYRISLAAGDTNGDTVALKFTASSASQRDVLIVTQA